MNTSVRERHVEFLTYPFEDGVQRGVLVHEKVALSQDCQRMNVHHRGKTMHHFKGRALSSGLELTEVGLAAVRTEVFLAEAASSP